jgi:Fe-S-cluster containining protein
VKLPEAFRALESIYADLEAELDRLRPACSLSGRCCRFQEHGHQLWVTRLELEHLLRHEGPPPAGAAGTCPWLKEGRCGAREHRMLGCRIYFCDPAYRDAMGPLYEKYHRRIRELHERLDLPYEYRELLDALRSPTKT